jgi:membrane dipeptidase
MPDRLDISDTARQLHSTAHVVDLHVDSLLLTRLFRYDIRKRHRNPFPYTPFFCHADLPRLKDGGVDTVGFGIVVNPLLSRTRRWAQVFDSARSLIRSSCSPQSRLRIARTVEDIRRGKAQGAVTAFLGIEGAHALAEDLTLVEKSYELGVRYLTLAHFSANDAAFPSKGRGADSRKGLTSFGLELVQECNRVGIAIDLAHTGRRCFFDAIEKTRAPVMVSHTGVSGVHASARNIDDDQIKEVARGGGTIGVIFAPCFLSGRLIDSAERIVDHIDHIVYVSGVDYVSLGSDFDGFIPSLPGDLRDAADFPVITELLLRRGYGEEDVRKILGENAIRVLVQVERERGDVERYRPTRPS